jgi:hypothetical protein
MGRLLAFLILVGLVLSCTEQRPSTNALPKEENLTMDPKLRELDALPEGIEVMHSPVQVSARIEQQPGKRPYYRWVYATTVRSKRETVIIVEFGSFAWQGDRWVFANFTGQPFSSKDFAEWYSCPDGKLVPGKQATDPSNWSDRDDQLRASRGRWYFIGINEAGRRVKCEAIVELLAEVE